MTPLTLKDIYRSVESKLGITNRDAKRVVDAALETISSNLIDLRPVLIRGFGHFKLKHRSARIARNPRAGEQIEVPACSVVVFKPGMKIKYGVIRKTVVVE